MTVIGVTGSSGSGKSTLTGVFARHGALICDADAIYHRLLAESAEMRDALTAEYGEGILSGNRIDRKKLGAVVFSDSEKLLKLNSLTHPFVIAEIVRMLETTEASLAVVDAPLLFESGLDGVCDVTVGVLAPWEARLARIMARDNITEEAASARLSAQKPASYYIERADLILHNDTSAEAFAEKAEKLYEDILKR